MTLSYHFNRLITRRTRHYHCLSLADPRHEAGTRRSPTLRTSEVNVSWFACDPKRIHIPIYIYIYIVYSNE